MKDERGDYKMIEYAAGAAFSRLHQPIVPAWVNRQSNGIADETAAFDEMSEETQRYILELQSESNTLEACCLFFGGLALMLAVLLFCFFKFDLIAM